MEKYNEIQQIKRRFYAMRNGVTADGLRNAGLGYRYIFGLNIPQLADIAAETGMNQSLALELRDDTLCRESMLLAPMIYPPEMLTADEAMEWIAKAPTIEVIDILCHRLLRNIPAAWDVIDAAMQSEIPLIRYAAARLTFNMLYSAPDRADAIARTLSDDSEPLVARVAAQMLDELEFLKA